MATPKKKPTVKRSKLDVGVRPQRRKAPVAKKAPAKKYIRVSRRDDPKGIGPAGVRGRPPRFVDPERETRAYPRGSTFVNAPGEEPRRVVRKKAVGGRSTLSVLKKAIAARARRKKR